MATFTFHSQADADAQLTTLIREAMGRNDWQRVQELRTEWAQSTGLGFPDSKHDGLPPSGSYGFASPAAATLFFDAGRWLEGSADLIRAAQQQARKDTEAYFGAQGTTPEAFFAGLTPEQRGIDPTKAVVDGRIVPVSTLASAPASPPPAGVPAAVPVATPATALALGGELAEVSPPAQLGPTAQAPAGTIYAPTAGASIGEQAAAAVRRVPGWAIVLAAVASLAWLSRRAGS